MNVLIHDIDLQTKSAFVSSFGELIECVSSHIHFTTMISVTCMKCCFCTILLLLLSVYMYICFC